MALVYKHERDKRAKNKVGAKVQREAKARFSQKNAHNLVTASR